MFSFNLIFWVNTKSVMLFSSLLLPLLQAAACRHQRNDLTGTVQLRNDLLDQSDWKNPSLLFYVHFHGAPKLLWQKIGESLSFQSLASQVKTTKNELAPRSSMAFVARATVHQTETAKLVAPCVDLVLYIRI